VYSDRAKIRIPATACAGASAGKAEANPLKKAFMANPTTRIKTKNVLFEISDNLD